jgi:tetratricopeptide (TPR) repeat protein
MKPRRWAGSALGILLFAAAGWAQTTSSIEGDVKGEDGQPLKGALVKIDREDIKGHYQVKTDKKGHYFHAGLPLGQYKVTLEVDGKDVDFVDKVHTGLGDPSEISFDLHASAAKRAALNQAANNGQVSKEVERSMTAEQKAALEKATKERAAALQKNKELNAAFNAGMEAQTAKQYDTAIQQFTKATEIDPNQSVVWAHLGDSYKELAATKTGDEQQAALGKGVEAYQKAIALKPDDAAIHNNYGLALALSKKFDDAQTELGKAAQLDPTNAGKYYYNLGALLVNNGQTEPAGAAFKKAIEADPNYADAQYQYGIYLIAKAQVDKDGKVTPVPGTKEAFQKYLELKPDGPFADSAKAMLTSIGATLDTSYQNPKKTTKKK